MVISKVPSEFALAWLVTGNPSYTVGLSQELAKKKATQVMAKAMPAT